MNDHPRVVTAEELMAACTPVDDGTLAAETESLTAWRNAKNARNTSRTRTAGPTHRAASDDTNTAAAVDALITAAVEDDDPGDCRSLPQAVRDALTDPTNRQAVHAWMRDTGLWPTDRGDR